MWYTVKVSWIKSDLEKSVDEGRGRKEAKWRAKGLL